MNATIGRGTAVHLTINDNGNSPICGGHMRMTGSTGVSPTTQEATCRKCLAIAPPAETYKLTYQTNTIARGWVTKEQTITDKDGTPAAKRVEKIAANMIKHPAYRLLSSEKI